MGAFNARYRLHRSSVLKERIALGDWLIARKDEMRTRGDLWGDVFKHGEIDFTQATAEKYMQIARNSVMRESSHAKIWPSSFYLQWLLSSIPESRLQQLIDARRIRPTLTREETEALVRQARPPSRAPVKTFGRSINGAIQEDLWHNRPSQLFGSSSALGNEQLPPGAQLYEMAKDHVRDPYDLVTSIMMQATRLTGERGWGENQPNKFYRFLAYVFLHERVEDVLNDLCRPGVRHDEYINRVIRDALGQSVEAHDDQAS